MKLVGVAFLLVVALAAGFYFICPPSWDYFDGFQAHFGDGTLSEYTITKSYYFGFYKISLLFIWIGRIFPALPVVGLVAEAFFIAMFTVLTWVFLSTSSTRGNKYIPASVIPLVPLFIPTLVHPSLTGISILGAGVSLYGMVVIAAKINGWKKYVAYTFFAACSVFAVCTRAESAIAGNGIVGVYLLLFNKNRLNVIIRSLPPAIFTLIISTAMYGGIKDEPFLYNTDLNMMFIADGDNDPHVEYGMATKDSIKTVALKTFFMNDEEELTVDFIAHVAALKREAIVTQPETKLDMVFLAWNMAKETIVAHPQFLLLSLTLLLLVLFTARHLALQFCLYHLFFWGVVFVLAYVVRIEDRHYIYLSQLFVFCNLVELQRHKRSTFLQLYVPAVLSSGLSAFLVYNYYFEGLGVKQKLQSIDKAVAEINVVADNKVLLLDSYSRELFNGSPFKKINIQNAKHLVFYDFGEMPLLQQYKNHLNTVCSCNSSQPLEMFKWAADKRNNVLVVSVEQRMNFFEEYMRVVHNYKLQSREVNGGGYLQHVNFFDQKLGYYIYH